MGCGVTTLKVFNIYILDIVQTNELRKAKLIQKFKDTYTMINGKSIEEYIKSSANIDIKDFFENKENSQTIYHFIFDDNTICAAEDEEGFEFVPIDRFSYHKKGSNAIILKNLFIIPTIKFPLFNLPIIEFYEQIKKLVDPREFIFNTGDYEINEEPSELAIDSSNDSLLGNENNEEREKKLFNEEDEERSDNNSFTDYDSDSSNSLGDLEPQNPEELECNNKLDSNIVDKFNNILNKENNKQVSLTALNIKFNKIKETKVLGKLLTSASSIPQTKKGEPKNMDNSQKPKFLQTFEFIGNTIEQKIEKDCWDLICSFINSKRTYKSEFLDKAEIKERQNKVLRTLDLSMNNINDSYFKQIIKSIRNVRLHVLDLSGNNITSVLSLSHWLIKNKSLYELNLDNNKNIKVDEILEVINSLKVHGKISLLDLSQISLKDTGKEIASLFSRVKYTGNSCKLKILILKDCNLNYTDILEIYESAIAKDSTLEQLDISGNNTQGNPEINKLLIGFISNCSNLSILTMDNNSINQYQSVAEAIGNKSFGKSKLIRISISDHSINYFSLLTVFIKEISNIRKKVTKEVEIVAINETKKLDEADTNLEKEFLEHKSSIIFHFE